MSTVAGALKAQPADVLDRLKALMDERKTLQNEISNLKQQVAMGGGSGGGAETKEIGGKTFLGQALQGVSGKDLRGLIDEHKEGLEAGAVVLIADTDGKAAVAAGVTVDLVDRVSAVDLVRAAVEVLGGKGGGGRPDMAQGGAKDISNADGAVAAAKSVLGG